MHHGGRVLITDVCVFVVSAVHHGGRVLIADVSVFVVSQCTMEGEY